MPRHVFLIALFAIALSACTTGPLKDWRNPLSRGNGFELLETGVRDYENGDYARANTRLRAALEAGLNWNNDRAVAHKYLAFIECANDRHAQCRNQFSMALSADQKFALTPTEAGHPIWGPVYREVKLKAAKP